MKYSHMMPADLPIWIEYLNQRGHVGDMYQYDVKVGNYPVGIDPKTEPDIALADGLYKKRIDAMMQSGQHTIIYEVKPRAGSSAIGQLLVYGALYHRENQTTEYPKLCLITDDAQTDIEQMCALHGIYIYETQGLVKQTF